MNISDREYERYLKRYEDRFVIFRDSDKIWKIKCHKYNHIDVWDADNKILCFSVCSCSSNRGLNIYENKFKKSKCWFDIAQRGDSEMNVLFKESDIDHLAYITKPKERKSTYRNVKKAKPREI